MAGNNTDGIFWTIASNLNLTYMVNEYTDDFKGGLTQIYLYLQLTLQLNHPSSNSSKCRCRRSSYLSWTYSGLSCNACRFFIASSRSNLSFSHKSRWHFHSCHRMNTITSTTMNRWHTSRLSSMDGQQLKRKINICQTCVLFSIKISN